MSNNGDRHRRRHPSTTDEGQPYSVRHAGARRLDSNRTSLQQDDGSDEPEREGSIPRFSGHAGPDDLRGTKAHRASDPETDDYYIRSSSKNGPRVRAEHQGDDQEATLARSSHHRPQSQMVVVQPAGDRSRRPPSSYHYHDRSSRNSQGNSGARVNYEDENHPPLKPRRLSYSQDSESTYTPHAVRSHYLVRHPHADDGPTQQDLALRSRTRDSDSAQPLISASDALSSRGSLPEQPPPTIITSGKEPTHGTSVHAQISAQTTTNSASRRLSESSFRSSLSGPLLQFANIPRNDWKAIESFVAKDSTILDAKEQLFLKEAILAFSIGKDEYARQCIHRIALLQQVEKCSVKTAIKTIKNIGERKSEAKDFLQTYDRIQTAAKERASAMPASVGPGVAQPSPPAPGLTPASTGTQISSDRRGDIRSHQRHTSMAGSDVRAQPANISAIYHRPSQPSAVYHQPDLSQGNPRTYPYPTQASPFAIGASPNTGTLDQTSSRPNDINSINYMVTASQAQSVSRESDESDDENATTPKPTSRPGGSIISIGTSDISVTGENTFPLPTNPQGQLDPRFQPRHHSFYKVGTVFSVLWHVPGSTEPPKGHLSEKRVLTAGKYGEPIYSTIRRMVVVREGHGYCVCIQINTYGGRGLKKFSRTPGEINNHSIIHMTDTQPFYIRDEPESNKRPIAVKKANQYQKLEPESRICYSQPSTVQHNVKAMPVGQVTRECLPYLVHYYKQANN